MVNTDNWL